MRAGPRVPNALRSASKRNAADVSPSRDEQHSLPDKNLQGRSAASVSTFELLSHVWSLWVPSAPLVAARAMRESPVGEDARWRLAYWSIFLSLFFFEKRLSMILKVLFRGEHGRLANWVGADRPVGALPSRSEAALLVCPRSRVRSGCDRHLEHHYRNNEFAILVSRLM